MNVYDAKTHLSRLLRRVRAGEAIVIADAGKPIARLVPIEPAAGPRTLGGDEKTVWLAEDFDAPLPDDVLAAFYRGDDLARRPKRAPRKTRRGRKPKSR